MLVRKTETNRAAVHRRRAVWERGIAAFFSCLCRCPGKGGIMQTITITGGQTLHGTIRPAAAKNSVLPLLAATLLCGAPCCLRGAPALSDVDTSLALLEAVGAKAVRHGADLCTLPVHAADLCGEIPPHLAGAMRSSVFYLAPLLCRVGMVRLPLPGGCRLGPRPVDIHLAGLAAMGARVELEGEAVTLRRTGPLQGVDFALRLPSVGATMTLLMAACCAMGTTVLRGAACEPEVCDLAAFLCACGAKISGAGTPLIVIQGRHTLGGTLYTPLPDRIAAATYAAALAAAGGTITVEGCAPAYYEAFLQFLEQTGVAVTRHESAVTLQRDPGCRLRGGQHLYANGWPAFATDTAPLAAAVLLEAEGASEIYDHLFANRFACAAGFRAMGADCQASGHRLRIAGNADLHAATVSAPDLRGGAALMVAALAASGTTVLQDPGHIRRGYADLPAELARLGAQCIPLRQAPVR